VIFLVEENIVIGIKPGIHFRPAEKITEASLKYDSEIKIKKDNYEANVKSFLSLLGAGLKYDDKVTLMCSGKDETEALETMKRIFTDEDNNKTNNV